MKEENYICKLRGDCPDCKAIEKARGDAKKLAAWKKRYLRQAENQAAALARKERKAKGCTHPPGTPCVG